MRELYGAMLLERGMAKEALRATFAREPNRYNAFAGAAKAAACLGDPAKSKAYSEKLVAMAGSSARN